MAAQKQLIRPVGIRQDNLIGTGNSSKYAHEIKNLRFTADKDFTTAVWTTEQGTLQYDIVWEDSEYDDYHALDEDFKGTVHNTVMLGTSVINDVMVCFCKLGNDDYIFKIWFDDDVLKGMILFKGDLNFNIKHPFETIPYYENELVQKVYWIDNYNQPRMINIVGNIIKGNTTQFDFVRNVALRENVTVEKIKGLNGQFPPCTVKYAITYYNKYGQESNIVWTSTLLYPIKDDRGLKDNELSGDCFKITISQCDTQNGFDHIRLYSIVRTSDNATPVVRIVEDKPINSIVTFVDGNISGEIIDPTILLYVGGKEFLADTFEQKDNTLFFGNLTLRTKSIAEFEKKYSLTDSDWGIGVVPVGQGPGFVNIPGYRESKDYKPVVFSTENKDSFYNWKNQLDNTQSPKIFKSGETYRFGIQFQDNKGNWSDVKYLGDYINNTKPTASSNVENFGVFRYILPANTAFKLIREGYVKSRLVCCFPDNSDRTILAQGVLCPTVYNEKYREVNSPDYMSSWFFRPYKNSSEDIGIEDFEFQSDSQNEKFNFKIAREVVTFHSPDIEFDESLKTLDWSNVKVRIVGFCKQTGYATKLFLEAEKQAEDYLGYKGDGFIDKATVKKYNDSTYPWKPIVYKGFPWVNTYGYWNDIDVYNSNYIDRSKDKYQIYALKYNYLIHPFQRKYLNNYMGDLDIDVNARGTDIQTSITESSIIKSKVWSTLRFSDNTVYNNIINDTDIARTLKIFDSTENIPVRIENNIYFGNVDLLTPIDNTFNNNNTGINYIKEHVCPIFEYQGLNPPNGEDNVNGSGAKVQTSNVINYFTGSYRVENVQNSGKDGTWNYKSVEGINGAYVGIAKDPIRVTYKSTPHCVMFLNTPLTSITSEPHSILLAELYRDNVQQRFGGTTKTALLNNNYIPCSITFNLRDYEQQGLTMYHTEGDTYYMRYDCLKTYPRSTEDINQIVDIFSFMCETRINLDGRCDINRALTDNTTVNNANFNIINKAYTQSDNFFIGKVIDPDIAVIDSFPNQITWTKTKISGEDVDTWTNVTLANIADSEGTFGAVTKLTSFKNQLLMFQEHALGFIGFNEKSILTQDNGAPLELAYSNKFTGFSYLTKNTGCQNKWSVCNTRNGVFFIDDSRHEINLYGESLRPISTEAGLNTFMLNSLKNAEKVWSPDISGNFRTWYDKQSKDVYFVNNDVCLAWNELTGSFTSFYDYDGMTAFETIDKHSVAFKGSFYGLRENDAYSVFFNENKPYWITFASDGENNSIFDKIFNVVEFNGDLYNAEGPAKDGLNNTNINANLFNKISVWNGYQFYNEFYIDGTTGNTNYPWKAERKFNTWRVIVPRASYKDNYDNLYVSRDRIRSPFCYIKLLNDNVDSQIPGNVSLNRAVFHDFVVNYDIK